MQTSKPLTEIDVVSRFESLGSNCELGLFQRLSGAEPLGLFRFSSSTIANLMDVVSCRCETFLDEADLDIRTWPNDTEYMVSSLKYDDFRSHTSVRISELSLNAVRKRELQKARYLKGLFLEGLSTGEKIYVRCGTERSEDILALHFLINKSKPTSLLWVTADEPHRRGQVEVVAPGLYKGYTSFPAQFGLIFRLDTQAWKSICRQTIRLVESASGTELSLLMKEQVLYARDDWQPTAACKAQRATSRIARRLIYRLASLFDLTAVVPLLTLDLRQKLEARKSYVFSTWIYIPQDFAGHYIDLEFVGAEPLHRYYADLRQRNVWQQIWVSCAPREARDTSEIALRSQANSGDTFYLSGWQLESGSIPSENLKPEDDGKGDLLAPPRQNRLRRSTAEWLRRASNFIEPSAQEQTVDPTRLKGELAEHMLRTSDLLIGRRRFLEADAVLEAGLTLFPCSHEMLSHFALSAHNDGRPAVAADRWRKVIDVRPEVALSHYCLAACLRELGDIDEATAIIESALVQFPRELAVTIEAAHVFGQRGELEKALSFWDEAVAVPSPHPAWLAAREATLQAIWNVDAARSS